MNDARPRTVPALLADAAHRWPDAEALVESQQRWTWARLHEDVRRGAVGLVHHGLRPGDRVGLWAPNTARWVVAGLAVLEAGGVLVPLSSRLRGFEVLDALGEARADLLLMQAEFLGRDNVDLLLDASWTTGRPCPRLVLLDDHRPPAAPAGAARWIDLVADAPDDLHRLRVAKPSGSDLSDVLFTSGTTGRSRGVAMTHAQVVGMAAAWSQCAGLRQDDRYLVLSPMSHTFGYKTGLLACLSTGATLLPAALADPEGVIGLLVREAVTVLPGVPAALRAVAHSPALPPADELSVRLVVTGAAPCEPQEIRDLRTLLGAPIVLSAYGLTEAGPVTMCESDTADDKVATTAGRALPGVEVAIRDSDGREAAAGRPGEVMVRSPFVGVGLADLDTAAPGWAGWLATGDVGIVDVDGYLTIVDRIKDVIQTGGFSVYPAEVEGVITDLTGVQAASVIGVPDQRLGEVGVAYVVTADGNTDTDVILAHCRARLAGFKVPRRVVVVPELPRNATGKVLKRELRDLAARP